MGEREKKVLTVRNEERRLVWERISETFGKVQKWADDEWEQEWTEEVNVEFAIYNRIIYAALSREGQGLEFVIFDDGVMGVNLQESCHKNRIFELVTTDEVPNMDWKHLREDIDILLQGYIYGNWHEIMDYIGDSLEWRECIECYFKENEIFPRGGSTTYIM